MKAPVCVPQDSLKGGCVDQTTYSQLRLAEAPLSFSIALSCIMGTRIMINLREAALDDSPRYQDSMFAGISRR